MKYATFSSDVKSVLNCGLIKKKKHCNLFLLTHSHFCACFSLMVMDMDQNILDGFSYQNHLIEHGVNVLSAVEVFFYIYTCFQPVIVLLCSALMSQAPTCTTAAATLP